MWVRSMGQEDPWVRKIPEGMAAYSTIIAWEIPWTEEPFPWVRKELDTTEVPENSSTRN